MWELISRYDYDLHALCDELKALLEDGLVEYRDGMLSVTEEGEMALEDAGIAPRAEVRCERCRGRGIVYDAFIEAFETYLSLTENRPAPVTEYDQGYIAPEDVMLRVAFIYERGDLEGKDILVIGDDDLVSLALAATGLPHRVRVLEIDERLVDYINGAAKEYGFPVEAGTYDVREELPPDILGLYDVFITDPVETLPGIRLFLSRAASGLKGEGSAGYFGLTTQESSLRKWREIEKMLLDMNFAITDILRRFSTYPNTGNIGAALEEYPVYIRLREILGDLTPPDTDFYSSSLVRVELVDRPRPLVTGHVELTDEIYVDDEAYVTAKASRVLR